MYYGTVARYQVKAGHEEKFLEQMKSFKESPPPGWTYTTLFRGASDPNEIWMSVVFESEQLLQAECGQRRDGSRIPGDA